MLLTDRTIFKPQTRKFAAPKKKGGMQREMRGKLNPRKIYPTFFRPPTASDLLRFILCVLPSGKKNVIHASKVGKKKKTVERFGGKQKTKKEGGSEAQKKTLNFLRMEL